MAACVAELIACILLWYLLQSTCSTEELIWVFSPKTNNVEPVSVVQAEGLKAKFLCLYPGAHSHRWGINGVFPTDAEFPNVFPNFTHTRPSGGNPATLTIPALPQYNDTVVQCEAFFREGDSRWSVLSGNVTLLVQGRLGSVTNFVANKTLASQTFIFISWSAPFSLNLTTADPDIQYCVDVYSVTGGGSHHLDSVCGITDTQYTYTAPDPTGVYNFTVTPRSNVQGSLNGTTSQPVQGYTIQMPEKIPVQDIRVVVKATLNSIVMTVSFPLSVFQGIFPGSIPTSYELKLEFLDGTHNSPYHCQTTDSVQDGMVVLEDIDCGERSISKHEIFTLSVVSLDSVGSSISRPQEISTHDTQVEEVVYSSRIGKVVVNCSYLEGSLDLGFLVIESSESGFNYGVVYRENNEEFTAVAINGTENSTVLVYDLQEDASPEKTPATLQPIPVVRSSFSHGARNLSASPQIKVHVTTPSRGKVCFSCNDSCLGIVHLLDANNFTLIVVNYTLGQRLKCTNESLPSKYSVSVAVFGFLSGRLDESPIYQKIISVWKPEEPAASKNLVVNIIITIGSILGFSVLTLCLVFVVVGILMCVE